MHKVVRLRIPSFVSLATLAAFRSSATMALTGKPTVVVMHATGKQGSGVVNALLRSGQYRVKAVTRDAAADSAP